MAATWHMVVHGDRLALLIEPDHDDVVKKALQCAHYSCEQAAFDGSVEVSDFAENTLAELGDPWRDYFYALACVRGGRFDGMRAVGGGSNVQTRHRAARLALGVACRARVADESEDLWKGKWTADEFFVELVSRLRDYPEFLQAYGRFPVAAAPESERRLPDHRNKEPEYRNKDLRTYVETWTELVNMEWDAECGPSAADDGAVDAGRTILDAKVVALDKAGHYQAIWIGPGAARVKAGDKLRATRVSAEGTVHKHEAEVLQRPRPREVELRWKAPADVSECLWRFDLTVNGVPYYRMLGAIAALAHKQTCALQATLCEDPVVEGRRALASRREPLCDPTQLEVQALGSLNANQREALSRVLYPGISLVQGPPGTGKTQVAAAAIRVLSTHAAGPVLAAAQSHTAVDNMALRVVHSSRVAAARVGKLSAMDERLHHIAVSKMAMQPEHVGPGQGPAWERQCRDWEAQFLSQHACVVFATLMGAGGEHLRHEYGAVLIDEAAQAIEPAALVALVPGRAEAHFVLGGDHMQLPPQVESQAAGYHGLSTSLFERLFELPAAAGIPKTTLAVQYRMAPSIAFWPNTEFYQGRLRDSDGVHAACPVPGFPWARGRATAFVHVEGEEDEMGHSRQNLAERDAVGRLVRDLLNAGAVSAQDIGVLAPYDAQRRVLQAHLRTMGAGAVQVANVDAFQGREKEVIIVSLTRAGGLVLADSDVFPIATVYTSTPPVASVPHLSS